MLCTLQKNITATMMLSSGAIKARNFPDSRNPMGGEGYLILDYVSQKLRFRSHYFLPTRYELLHSTVGLTPFGGRMLLTCAYNHVSVEFFELFV